MQIRVSLMKPDDRPNWNCRWIDPTTGKPKYSSSGTRIKRDAERYRARLEHELNESDFRKPLNVTWAEFRRRYEEEVGPTKARKTFAKTRCVFKRFEEIIGPKYLTAVTASVISMYATKLRSEGAQTWTVRGHLSELRKTLRWAYRIGLLRAVPPIDLPRATHKSKGRPITMEEFERFLATVPKIINNAAWVSNWTDLCKGFWLSGMRLSEIMSLHWSDPTQILIDMSGKLPLMRIPADRQKNRKEQVLPLTPDFAEFLGGIPADQRVGFVFNPWTMSPHHNPGPHRPTADHVGKVLSKIGKEALIPVSDKKNASAHDFRRSFAKRWAMRVPARALAEMMRHSSSTITDQFYLDELAVEAGEQLRRAAGHSFGHSPSEPDPSTPPPPTENA